MRISLVSSLLLLLPAVWALDSEHMNHFEKRELLRRAADDALASFVSGVPIASATASPSTTGFSRVTKAAAASPTATPSPSLITPSATATSFPATLLIPFEHFSTTSKVAVCVGAGVGLLLLISLITWCISRRTTEEDDDPIPKHLTFDERATKMPRNSISRRRKSYKVLGE